MSPLPSPRRRLLLAGIVLAALLAANPASAEFYWPWQARPAPPPPAPPPVQHRIVPRNPPKPAAPRAADSVHRDDRKDAKTDKAETPPPDLPPPPYEPQLLRLSEILGALAFLRPLCGGSDADQWRTRMSTLIDSEANTPQRRERLAGAFNTGFREYAQTYRRCTPAAELVISRFAEEGGRLTRELSSRFGG